MVRHRFGLNTISDSNPKQSHRNKVGFGRRGSSRLDRKLAAGSHLEAAWRWVRWIHVRCTWMVKGKPTCLWRCLPFVSDHARQRLSALNEYVGHYTSIEVHVQLLGTMWCTRPVELHQLFLAPQDVLSNPIVDPYFHRYVADARASVP